MTTKYTNKLTVIVSQPDWDGANSLAACFGESGRSNLQTFKSTRLIRNGTEYALAETSVTDFVKRALAAYVAGFDILSKPSWDIEDEVDLELAETVLESALILTSFNPDTPPTYNGQAIIAVNCDRHLIGSAYGFEEVVY